MDIEIGARVYIRTMGGDLTGTLRGYATSAAWTLISDTRPFQDRAELNALVELDVPGTEIDRYDGCRLWPVYLTHPLELTDRDVVIDGRIFTRTA